MANRNNKSTTSLIIGALIVVALGLGYMVYKEKSANDEFTITFDENGVEVDGKD